MNNREIPNNPFMRAKTRTIIYWFLMVIPLLFLLYFTIGLLIDIPTLIRERNINFEDPIFNNIIINFCFYSVAMLWIWGYKYRTKFKFKYLLRNTYSLEKISSLSILIPLILISIGTTELFHYLLFSINPEVATQAMQQELFLTIEETAYPQLYNAIQFISVVVLAPIIEEMLFRGIFLHRWATKWSLRTAVITSSIAFGCLHFDFISSSIFGFAASLIYLKTKNLALPIAIHFLNNLFFVIISLFSFLQPTPEPTPTLETLQASLLPATLAIVIAFIWLTIFCRNNWRLVYQSLPYLSNRDRRKTKFFQINR